MRRVFLKVNEQPSAPAWRPAFRPAEACVQQVTSCARKGTPWTLRAPAQRSPPRSLYVPGEGGSHHAFKTDLAVCHPLIKKNSTSGWERRFSLSRSRDIFLRSFSNFYTRDVEY